MNLSFNSSGHLHKTVELTLVEFEQHFVYNALRKEIFKNAIRFLKIFGSCGCTSVYIGGSFVSTKKNPGDIDLCFDFTDVDREKFNKEFPEFFGQNRYNKLGEICRDLKCHIFTFKREKTDMLKFLNYDRDDNYKGLVIISLKKDFTYD